MSKDNQNIKKTAVNLRCISELKAGDIIQSKLNGKGYVVTRNYGDYVIAIRQVNISNESEWLKLNERQQDE